MHCDNGLSGFADFHLLNQAFDYFRLRVNLFYVLILKLLFNLLGYHLLERFGVPVLLFLALLLYHGDFRKVEGVLLGHLGGTNKVLANADITQSGFFL